MPAVYFSHGYRPAEARVNEFIQLLMANVGIIPSLDPPSQSVSAAKLERHLRFTDALVAVVASRDGSISQHIRFEVQMALRSRKPVVLFLEDTLPSGIFPSHILQARYSRRSFMREARDYLHLLQMLYGFIGKSSAPRYRVMARPRTAMVSGFHNAAGKLEHLICGLLSRRGYQVERYPGRIKSAPIYGDVNVEFAISDLAIVLIDSKSIPATYSWGAFQSSLTPTIFFTLDGTRIHADIPTDYQPINLARLSEDEVIAAVEAQIELYEQDFIEIDTERKAEAYASQLIALDDMEGRYSRETRTNIFKIVMGNETNQKIDVSGSISAGGDVSLSQRFRSGFEDVSLGDLARELASLREALAGKVSSAESAVELGAIAQAEMEAKKGDRNGALASLKRAGKWSLEIAEKIGVGVAVAAIKSAAGI